MAMKTNYCFNRNRFLSGLRFIALLLGCSAIAQSAIAVTPSFPLKKSANNRYLTTQDGTPFMLIGDSGWELPAQAREADIDQYLNDRASRGFNTVIIQSLDTFFSDNAPNNIDGVTPWTTPGYPITTANPAYYTRVDYIIDQAAAKGMVVLVTPLYLGNTCGVNSNGHVGWTPEIQAASTATMQTFGTFLGNRYKNKKNIIWVIGGDESPWDCGIGPKVNAFAAALFAADANHLITAHHDRGTEGIQTWLDHGGVPTWLKLNSSYTNSATYSLSQTAYNRAATLPFFTLESVYEGNRNISRHDLRAEAYWAILSGQCGYVFGNCPVWAFGSSQARSPCPPNGDWVGALNSNGAQDMTRFKNLFTSVAWQKLVPDFTHTVMTAGYGSGTTTATAARASDGTFVIAYTPTVKDLTFDMTALSGPLVTARWYDPTNSTYTTVSGSPFSNTGSHTFTRTGNNSVGSIDWVLVLESSTGTPTPTAPPSATPTPTPTAPPSAAPAPKATVTATPSLEQKLNQTHTSSPTPTRPDLQACL